MNVIQAQDAIRQRYHTLVEMGAQPVPFTTQHDNQPPTTSTGASIDQPVQSPWVRLQVQLVSSEQVEVAGVGANTHRHTGLVIAQVRTPVDTGEVDNLKICKFIADQFRSAVAVGSGGSVRFQTPRYRKIGRVDSAWQVNVICPFHFDEIG